MKNLSVLEAIYQAGKRACILCAFVPLCLCACIIKPVLAADRAELYVINALSEDISVVDARMDTVSEWIPLGRPGYRISFSPQGDKAYVTSSSVLISGDLRSDAGRQNSQLMVINLENRQIEEHIYMDISPLANVHIHPDGRRAFVVTAAAPGKRNTERGRVLFVDLQRRRVTRTVNIGLNPLDSVMTPNGQKLYTVDWASKSISVVNLAEERLEDTIPLGSGTARTLTMSPDGRHLYLITEAQPSGQKQASAGESACLWEVDTSTNGFSKYPLGEFASVHALTINDDGTRLYAYGALLRQNSAQARIWDSMSNTQNPESKGDVYDLAVYDLRRKRIVDHFGNFGFFSAMVLSPAGEKLYLVGTPAEARPDKAARQGKAMTDIIEDLSRKPKTITVIDADNGEKLRNLEIGSLMQGCALLVKS